MARLKKGKMKNIYILRVAITFAPLPQMFFTTTWPARTGGHRVTLRSVHAASMTSAREMGQSVLTGQRGCSPLKTLTVEVRVRTGFSHSARPYSAPRGQVFPVTVKLFFSST
jgi:predicted NUDIX family NTP pyrophosphohydrolase